jgi:hypothetical protein
MNLSSVDRTILTTQLGQLARAVEELLSAGLTTAGQSTRETLDVTFREASRLKLLRVASTLRAANEEIGRFVNSQPEFSARRLGFFLNRAWLLARGLLRALAANDEAEWDRLLWMPKQTTVDSIKVVTIGVGKKVAKGSFCAFEFRLRRIDPERTASQTATTTKLVWSCIFPMKPGVEIPPEAFLQLPQKQKFKASAFLEGTELTLTNVLISTDDWGNGRVTLTESSTVTTGKLFKDWQPFAEWSAGPLLHRIQKHDTSPFDLEIELQEDIVLKDWTIGARQPDERDGQIVFPVTAGPLQFDAVVSSGSDGEALIKRLTDLIKKKQPDPLLGLLHFDRCRLLLQPLSLLTDRGPELITISNDKVDKAALLKTLKF